MCPYYLKRLPVQCHGCWHFNGLLIEKSPLNRYRIIKFSKLNKYYLARIMILESLNFLVSNYRAIEAKILWYWHKIDTGKVDYHIMEE